MNKQLYRQIEELQSAGYHIGTGEYPKPNGSIYDDAVIYPNGVCQTLAREVGHRHLTIEEQWSLAWLHYTQRDYTQS